MLGILVILSCTEKSTKEQSKSKPLSQTDDSQFETLKDSISQKIPVYSDPFCENIPKDSERELDSVITIFERALRVKDTNLLMSLMDSNIVSSHGGCVTSAKSELERA